MFAKGWHVCRTKLSRMISSVRGLKFLLRKLLRNFPRKNVEPLSCGSENNPVKFPPNFPHNFPKNHKKNHRDELLQERRENSFCKRGASSCWCLWGRGFSWVQVGGGFAVENKGRGWVAVGWGQAKEPASQWGTGKGTGKSMRTRL